MKVFVTGVAGQLGHDVMNELAKRGYEGIGTDIAPEYSGAADGTAVVSMPYVSLDITDADAVDRVICEMKPDVVVHCAAWTAVDLAEDEDKKDKVHAINADGTANIAKACKKTGSKMVYISTDYVFDGQGTTPWTPDCKDYKPLNVYGQSKLDGELAVSSTLDNYFIVRIAWVFGKNGKNFIKTMLNVAKTHSTLKVVNDQIGTPTYTFDLARLLVDMIETDKYGYYHVTNAATSAGMISLRKSSVRLPFLDALSTVRIMLLFFLLLLLSMVFQRLQDRLTAVLISPSLLKMDLLHFRHGRLQDI